MPKASAHHSAIELDGLIYVVGTGDNDSHRVQRFDPASNSWSTIAPSTLSDGRFGSSFVLGGSLYAADGSVHNANVERYNAATDTWTAVADMLEGRSGFESAVNTIGPADPVEEQDLFDKLIASVGLFKF